LKNIGWIEASFKKVCDMTHFYSSA